MPDEKEIMNMKHPRLLLAIATSLAFLNGARALAQSGGPYALSWNTLDGGGATFSTGAGISVGGTVGQPDASRSLSGGTYALAGGFWAGIAPPAQPTPTVTPTRTATASIATPVPPTVTSTRPGAVRPTPTRTTGQGPTVTSGRTATATPTGIASRSRTPTATITPTPDGVRTLVCAGDCDENQHVRVDELVRGVYVCLGTLQLRSCPALDANRDQSVTIDELVMAVNSALNGCPDLPQQSLLDE